MDESAGTVKSIYEPAEPIVPFWSNKLYWIDEDESGEVPKRRGCDKKPSARLLSEVSNRYVFPFSIRRTGASSPLIKYLLPSSVETTVTVKVWSCANKENEKRKKKVIEIRKCRRVVIPVVKTEWCGFNSFNNVTLRVEVIWFLKLFSGSITIIVKLPRRNTDFLKYSN